MPLIYYKPDGSWTCGSCGTPHPKEETSCVCMTPKAVEDAEPATDHDLATARHIVETVPNHGFVSVPAQLLARLVKRAKPMETPARDWDDGLEHDPSCMDGPCRLCAQHEIDLLAAKPVTSLLQDWKLTLRPWLDTAIGRPGTITGDEWLSACDRVEAALIGIDGNVKETVGRPPSEANLISLAIAYHKADRNPDGTGGEGEYGCPGASCPGVQRLVAFLKQAIGSITSSARL